jgi:hypothetical protein
MAVKKKSAKKAVKKKASLSNPPKYDFDSSGAKVVRGKTRTSGGAKFSSSAAKKISKAQKGPMEYSHTEGDRAKKIEKRLNKSGKMDALAIAKENAKKKAAAKKKVVAKSNKKKKPAAKAAKRR